MLSWLYVLLFVVSLPIVWLARKVWRRTHWWRRGILTYNSSFWLGSLADAFNRKRSAPYILKDIYNEIRAKGKSCGGIFLGWNPSLLITEPELVRDITVAYFDYFVDRRPFNEKGADELLERSLLNLRGQQWRQMRHTLSPAFTGSKLRGMMPLMESTAQELAKFLVKQTTNMDMRDVFRRFAADVIASTAFGVEANAIADPKAEFYDKGKSLLTFGRTRTLILKGYLYIPAVMRFLGIRYLPPDLSDFFFSIINETVAVREKGQLNRPDMIQLLIDQRQKGMGIPNTDMVAQAFAFFLGGYETVATALSFAALHIAANPDVQQRLYEEINEALVQSEGKLGYETVQGLTYLDMVISEVLRLHPVVPFADRTCTKSLTLAEYNLHLSAGDRIAVPIIAFQHDPVHFSDPETFDPERFSEENKKAIKPFTYMPFGSGPRGCIGSRFALLEMKLGLAHTLAVVELRLGPDAKLPIRLDPQRLDNIPVGGFVLRTLPRPSKTV